MLWARFRVPLLPLLALLAAAPALPAHAQAAAGTPAIWLLADEDTRIYLFGTNHMLSEGTVWRSAELDAAIAEADELVLESDDDLFERKPERMAELMMLDSPRPVLERVSPEHRLLLERLLKHSSLPVEGADRLQTWAVGFVVVGAGQVPSDYPQVLTSVEEGLSAVFEEAGKPVSGLESAIEQMTYFTALSEEAQRAFLDSFLADVVEMEAGAGATGAAPPLETVWSQGDVAALGEQCDSDDAFSPELREALLTRRNRIWTDWLADRLERPGTLLFAVGACHLAGRGSLQAMLAQRGLATERVH